MFVQIGLVPTSEIDARGETSVFAAGDATIKEIVIALGEREGHSACSST